MKKIIIGLILLSFYITSDLYAHPGRTASDGCHYCRTNCDYWGVPWNERHCHGGTPSPSILETKPIAPSVDYSSLNSVSAKVENITDGDTIKVKISGDSNVYSVRLIGIDTPETVDPRKPVECFGKEATGKLKSLIEYKQVVLKRDSINDNKDKYNRLLRYVILNDKDINAEMIKQGYAYAYLIYPFEAETMSLYKDYERQARENKLGLWADGVCGNPIDSKPTVLSLTNEEEKKDESTTTTTNQNTINQLTQTNQQSENNKEYNFIVGFFWGTISTVIIIWGYKKIKKK